MEITLATLHQFTAQQVFDYIVAHLRKQNAKSVDKEAPTYLNPNCLYRSPEGLKCAAGCLIADDEYTKGFEGKTWLAVTKMRSHLELPHTDLISDMQRVHDSREVEGWERRFEIVANKYSLSYTPPSC